MTHTISIFTPIDENTKRRRALAKVYSLLISLAEEAEKEEAENQAALPEIINAEEVNSQ